jgi:rhamnogalacturonan endolyase
MTSNTKGWQMWSGAGGLWDVSHKSVGSKPGSTNFTMWWGADLTRSTEDGTSISPGLSTTGMASNNGTKSTPCLTADIFGDWREELVLRTSNNNALHIYTTTTPTTNRLFTLMHDAVYRMSVATENVAYNQPPEPGIYIGPGMTLPQAKPNIIYPDGTGLSPATISGLLQRSVANTMKVYADRTCVLPGAAGVMKTVMVYDLSGKNVANLTTARSAVVLADYGISRGVYLVIIRDRIDRMKP